MKQTLLRYRFVGLAAACLTVWGSYFYFLASVGVA
jgi:hypothetical protein